MDNLKTLMDKGEYELVIKLTESSNDTTSLFYRVAACVGSGKPQMALDCIEKNRKLLESDLAVLIKFHIETLCIVGQFDKAYQELEYYKNLPYASQEVEELLRDIPEYIRNEEKKTFGSKNMSEEQIKELLKSDDYNNVLIGLDIIRDKNYLDYIKDIKNVLVNYPRQSIRSFALLLLVQKEYDKEVEFSHIGEIIKVVPSELEPPFVGSCFNDLVKQIQLSFKNTTLVETAINALSTHLMYIYPEKISADMDTVCVALRCVACEYTSTLDESSLEEICNAQGLDIEEVKKLIKSIKESLSNF